MTVVLVVSADPKWHQRIDDVIRDSTVLVACDYSDALRQLGRMAVDVLLWAESSGVPQRDNPLDEVRQISDCVTIAIGHPDNRPLAEFVLAEQHTTGELEQTVRQAIERKQLLDELKVLRSRPIPVVPPDEHTTPFDRPLASRSLREFTRLLAAGFDLPRMLESFLDAVAELLRPARLALLMPDTNRRTTYRVRVHRGLAPQLAESIRLPSDRGLCQWLLVEGRPARVGDLMNGQIGRDLSLVQSAMAVPLLARGELVAVLAVGAPVIRAGYTALEVEAVFDLCTHVASAVDGIRLHQRLQRAGEFNQRILEHMSSGVVTIGADERLHIINRRAAEILQLPGPTGVGQDLRTLPSPLGDMLYETLRSGRGRGRTEIKLALRGLSLEVSTYPVHDDETTGAVLVFEDITAQKQLAHQKRQAEHFELLTRVVARIADEIKNPLVSVNTFMELIGERFDDPEFRKNFSSVVARDVGRLVQVFEKLTGLVSHRELHLCTVDVHSVVDDAVAAVRADADSAAKLDIHIARDPEAIMVNTDPGPLRRALSYLMWYLAHHSPDRAAVSITVGRRAETDGAEDARIVVGSRNATVPPQDAERLFDPVRMVQETLIDIGPAVSRRIVEAVGGRLDLRQGRHDVSFVLRLPVAG